MYHTVTNLSEQYNELWRETTVIYEQWARKRGISYYDLLVILSILEANKPCTQKLICEQWKFPKQTTHSILQNFLKKEWIVFAPLEDDRRNKAIILTEKGKQVMQKIVIELQEQEERVWNKLGRERSKALLENTALYNQYFMEVEERESL